MRPLLSSAMMRAFEDQLMQAGVPGALLMENAGRGAAHIIGLKGKPRTEAKAKVTQMRGSCVRCADEQALSGFFVFVLCGPGNNGGDGFVVARHLRSRAAQVYCCAVGQATDGSDAGAARRAFEAIGGIVHHVKNSEDFEQSFSTFLAEVAAHRSLVEPVFVDALFGTGLSRPLAGVYEAMAERVNAWGGAVVALDCPSGLNAETGSGGAVIRAEQTITFGHLKRGLLTTGGYRAGGRVTLSHIGVPAELPASIAREVDAFLLEERDVASWLRPRSVVTHKGELARVAVVAGKDSMAGAARLSARAALRAGAGITKLLVERLSEQSEHSLEVMLAAPQTAEEWQRELADHDALVLGPGLGRDEAARDVFEKVMSAARQAECALVLDADALHFLRPRDVKTVDQTALVLTPHPKEAAHLLGVSTEEIEEDRFYSVRRLAERYNATVVLKGPRTLVSDGALTFALAWGSASLATPGSGDVLSGVVAALLGDAWRSADASQPDPGLHFLAASARARAAPRAARGLRAAAAAASLHAMAGELFEERCGDAGLLASEVADLVAEERGRLLKAFG